MIKRQSERAYNTNLASEYLMMSLLSRKGLDAYLSLGNKKGVDIVITSPNGSYVILEVKGVNKNDDWLISSTGQFPAEERLFYALVGFEGKISDENQPAHFYIIPSLIISESGNYKIAAEGKTVYISHKLIKEHYQDYRNNFNSLLEFLEKSNGNSTG